MIHNKSLQIYFFLILLRKNIPLKSWHYSFLTETKRCEGGEGRIGWMFPRNVGDVLELSRGRIYPLFSGNNDISLCKGSKCRDDS